ncbi:hypothetical protein CI105_08090 [Candidatus Izimaplasma bacterium ZiA1]|uniref:immunoglobulin-like domain-containing protein n=1 Tax=Candidatus Izimoplasma sp. ZiA1 TaxID=2024899 RepID=UPI000BAA888F|nr:hypothetical protein CI105_08090 [Candidatus Izimaplasma bacterium ZiA1]
MKRIIVALCLIIVATLVGCNPDTRETSETLEFLLIGESEVDIVVGSDYLDGGYTLNLDLDVEVNSNIDSTTIGEYYVIYRVTYNNSLYTLTRTVNVVEESTNDKTFVVSILVTSKSDNSISISTSINDPDNQINSNSIKLMNGNTLIETIDVSSPTYTFNNLLSDTSYSICYTAEYFDGSNNVDFTKDCLIIKTDENIQVVAPNFFVVNSNSTESEISYTLDITGDISNISCLLKADTTLIKTISCDKGINNILVSDLLSNTTYNLEIEYSYYDPISKTTKEAIYSVGDISTLKIGLNKPEILNVEALVYPDKVVLNYDYYDPNNLIINANIYVYDELDNIVDSSIFTYGSEVTLSAIPADGNYHLEFIYSYQDLNDSTYHYDEVIYGLDFSLPIVLKVSMLQ